MAKASKKKAVENTPANDQVTDNSCASDVSNAKITGVYVEKVSEDTAEVAVEAADVESIAAKEIVKLDVNMGVLEEWRTKCVALKVTSLEDKGIYKNLKEAKSILRRTRTTTDARRKFLTEPFRKVTDMINKAGNDYIAAISGIESHVDAEIDKYEGWQKEEAEKAEREAQAKQQERLTNLLDAGISFTGVYYSINNISVDVSTLRVMEDADFNRLLEAVKLEKANNDAEAERKAEEARLEAIRVEEERKDMEAERERLEKERKDMEAEREAMRQQRITMREDMCKSIGMTFTGGVYSFKNKYVEIAITKNDIDTLSKDDFDACISDTKKRIEIALNNQLVAEKKEAEEKAQREFIVSTFAKHGVTPNSGGVLVWESAFHNSIRLELGHVDIFMAISPTQLSDTAQKAGAWIESIIAQTNDAQAKMLALGYTFDRNNDAIYNFNGEVDRVEAGVIALAIKDGRLGEVLEVCAQSVHACKVRYQEAQEKAEKERLAAMSDIDRMAEYITAIRAVVVPEFVTDEMKAVYIQLDGYISGLTDQLEAIK